MRSRFGITLTVLGVASALATALDPQGSLYNVRLLPLWFISVYLMAAWAFGTGCIAVGRVVAPGARPAVGGAGAGGTVGRGPTGPPALGGAADRRARSPPTPATPSPRGERRPRAGPRPPSSGAVLGLLGA